MLDGQHASSFMPAVAGTTGDSTLRWNGSAWAENAAVRANAAGGVTLGTDTLDGGGTVVLHDDTEGNTFTATVESGGVRVSQQQVTEAGEV